MLAARDVFHEARGLGGVELFETQGVELFEVGAGVVCGFEDLASQSREHERKTAASEDAQDFCAQHDRAVQVLGELRTVEHDERTATPGGEAWRRAERRADGRVRLECVAARRDRSGRGLCLRY